MRWFSNPAEKACFLEDLAIAYNQDDRDLFYFHINAIRQDYQVGWDDIYLAAVGLGLSHQIGDMDKQEPLDLD